MLIVKNLCFFLFYIKTRKCSGICNSTNDAYAKLCVPDIVENLNVKLFNLMSKTNGTRHIEWHETCKFKCRLDDSVCNNKQSWNDDKCRCKCKELIHKGVCNKGLIWNRSNCECECDKSCDVGDYLDYENCKCRKILRDKLVEECTETVEEVKLAKITSAENENKHKCSFCALYIVLFSILFTINVGIGTYFVYYNYMNRNKKTGATESFNYQTTLLYKTYKNRTYYFFNDINIKNFDSNLLKIDKMSHKNIGINYIGYITIKTNW